jgi:hypothetical protein
VKAADRDILLIDMHTDVGIIKDHMKRHDEEFKINKLEHDKIMKGQSMMDKKIGNVDKRVSNIETEKKTIIRAAAGLGSVIAFVGLVLIRLYEEIQRRAGW